MKLRRVEAGKKQRKKNLIILKRKNNKATRKTKKGFSTRVVKEQKVKKVQEKNQKNK